jgi:hypothetical protein
MARNKAIIRISSQLHGTFLEQERFIVLSTDSLRVDPRLHRGRANIFCPVHMRKIKFTISKGVLSFQAQCQQRCLSPLSNSRLTIIDPLFLASLKRRFKQSKGSICPNTPI